MNKLVRKVGKTGRENRSGKEWEKVGKQVGNKVGKRLGESREKVEKSWEQVRKRLGQVGEPLGTGKSLGQLEKSWETVAKRLEEDHNAARFLYE